MYVQNLLQKQIFTLKPQETGKGAIWYSNHVTSYSYIQYCHFLQDNFLQDKSLQTPNSRIFT